jgi:hypothetical protein
MVSGVAKIGQDMGCKLGAILGHHSRANVSSIPTPKFEKIKFVRVTK